MSANMFYFGDVRLRGAIRGEGTAEGLAVIAEGSGLRIQL